MLITAIGALIVNLIMGYFLHNVPGSHGHPHGHECGHKHKHSLFKIPSKEESVYESDSHKDSSDEEALVKGEDRYDNQKQAIKDTSVDKVAKEKKNDQNDDNLLLNEHEE